MKACPGVLLLGVKVQAMAHAAAVRAGTMEWTAHQSRFGLVLFSQSGGQSMAAPSSSCVMRRGPRRGWMAVRVLLFIHDTNPGQLHFRQRKSAWILHCASCTFVSHLTWNASDPTAITSAVFRLASISVLTGKRGFFCCYFSIRYLLLAVH